METPFFFKNEGRNLYGMTFVPGGDALRGGAQGEKRERLGILFCSAFAEEKLWSQRVMVSFARRLSKKGICAMTFDYRGHGDSEGDFVESTIETRLSDISRAMQVLRENAPIDKVGLLGLRLGGTLAAITSARREGIDFLVLWEPVLNVQEYLHQCLRSNLTTQLAIYRKIERTREQLVGDLLEGKAVNIDGYMVSGNFYREAIQINLERGNVDIPAPALIVKMVKRDDAPIPPAYEKLYAECQRRSHGSEIHKVREQPFWKECNTYPQEAGNLFSVTEDWIGKI